MLWSETMSRLRYAVLFCVALAAPAPTAADVTVCNGNSCTVVSGGTARVMSEPEVFRKFRSKSYFHALDIDCKYADDRATCDALRRKLMGLFQ